MKPAVNLVFFVSGEYARPVKEELPKFPAVFFPSYISSDDIYGKVENYAVRGVDLVVETTVVLPPPTSIAIWCA